MYFTSEQKSAIIHVDMKMAVKDGYVVSNENDIVIGVIAYLEADEY